MTGRPYAEAAWTYREAGWAGVIPIGRKPAQKSPPATGYTGYAGVDPSGADIQAWADGREGAYNLGVHLPPTVYVLDADARHGGTEGLEDLQRRAGVRLPPTMTSTARGQHQPTRQHFYRAVLPEGRVWKDHPARGVDSLHTGHRYAVMWPSVHPDTGTTYETYDDTGELFEGVIGPEDLAELPEALIMECSKPGEPMAGTAAGDEETLAVLRTYRAGPPCPEVKTGLDRELLRLSQADRASIHDPGRLFPLVANGLEGHAGVGVALSVHQAAYVAARTAHRGESEGGAAADWWRQVRGAVGKKLHALREEGEVPAQWCDCGVTPPVTEHPEHGAEHPADGPEWFDDLHEPGWMPGDPGEPAQAGAPPEPGWDLRVKAKVESLRLMAEAKDIFETERHARVWTPPVSFGTLAEELALPDEDVQWRIDGMLGAGHNAIIVAGRKTGKTTLVGNLIKSYVDGEPFLDRFMVEPSGQAVAVFNYEVDERQYRRWLRDVGIGAADRVFVLHLRGKTLPLRNDRIKAWVAKWLRDRDVGMWIVDPYSRAYTGSVDNGNDEAQVNAFLDTLDVIKAEAGVSELVMPVHTPKAKAEAGEETAIGSQRLEAWPDSMWYLTRDLESGDRFLRAEGRDVLVPEGKLDYYFHQRTLTYTGSGGRADAKKSRDVQALIDFVAKNPGCTKNAIREGLGWRYEKVDQVKAQTDRIEIRPGNNRGQLHYAK